MRNNKPNSDCILIASQIARLMGPTWGPPGSCRPQLGPMLAQWTLLSGIRCIATTTWLVSSFLHCCGTLSPYFWLLHNHGNGSGIQSGYRYDSFDVLEVSDVLWPCLLTRPSVKIVDLGNLKTMYFQHILSRYCSPTGWATLKVVYNHPTLSLDCGLPIIRNFCIITTSCLQLVAFMCLMTCRLCITTKLYLQIVALPWLMTLKVISTPPSIPERCQRRLCVSGGFA